ncbi:hypothetical protein SAMN02927924_01662 [Sphingobium faniae]|nr:hypothetical protein SAMN02927924_01662 [Sphingobium faniae]
MAHRIPPSIIDGPSQSDPQFIENTDNLCRLRPLAKISRRTAHRFRKINRFLRAAWDKAVRCNDVSQKHAFQGVSRVFGLGHSFDSHFHGLSENDRIARAIFTHRQNEEAR